jgi:hypothetical protein
MARVTPDSLGGTHSAGFIRARGMFQMLTSLRKLATAAGVVAIMAMSTPSYALPMLDGSFPLSGIIVSQNGANLSVSTLISATDTLVLGPGLGDYAPVALLSSFGPTCWISAAWPTWRRTSR